MKKLEEYTQEELLTMTQEAIDQQIEIECMLEGIQEAIHPGPKPSADNTLTKATYYSMPEGLLFATPGAALQAMDLASKVRDYASMGGIYTAKALPDSSEIKSAVFYDYEELSAIRKDLSGQAKALKEWETRAEAYQSRVKKINKVEERVYNALNEARIILGEEQRRQKAFEKFLFLSGSVDIASTFFNDMLTAEGWEEVERDVELTRIKMMLPQPS